ncbi:putative N-terminal acetyltransferase A complex auxiliary subunit NAA15 [Blattamonas nauphoetae]|uniref:N-terminal acetyltransferase A complex auxiliary subunit NAA15 n=1 Tax=Blattamonas nauphoetae TaxID=2049346 RepID=A0ABQ9Y5S0_9EUKA|nr:putative N-terminal acetyltransferase A complex auxiliary subunit NAA15 [Blattamonas nauphoetae]
MTFQDSVNKLKNKDRSVWKEFVTSIEDKDFKNAMKHSDYLLKIYPNHGETMCFRGLAFGYMGMNETAKELLDKGLACDPKSSRSWHTYGVYYAYIKDFRQAEVCYKKALEFDPTSEIILRDVSQMQIMHHEWNDLVKTRQIIMLQKPDKASWIGFIAANAISGNNEQALKALNSYIGTFRDGVTPKEECSGMFLYRAELLQRMKRYDEALQVLEVTQSAILDTVSWTKQHSDLLFLLNRKEEASNGYCDLLSHNSENMEYHARFLECQGLPSICETAEDSTKLVNLYSSLMSPTNTFGVSMPRSVRCLIEPLLHLNHVTQPELTQRLFAFAMFTLCERGVPSIWKVFEDVVISSKNRKKTIELFDIVSTECCSSIETNSSWPAKWRFANTSACLSASTETDPVEVDPSFILFAKLFCAYLADYCHQHAKAVSIIDSAIEHTPTMIELHVARARFMKHLGDLNEAAESMNRAHMMDEADRYLNVKAAKYYIHCGKLEIGESINAQFTDPANRDEDRTDLTPADYMYDEQAAWYFHTTGKGVLFRRGEVGRALKAFVRTGEIADDILNDMIDFQGFGLRRGSSVKPFEEMSLYMEHFTLRKEYVESVWWMIVLDLMLDWRKKTQGKHNAFEKLNKWYVEHPEDEVKKEEAATTETKEDEPKSKSKKKKSKNAEAKEKMEAAHQQGIPKKEEKRRMKDDINGVELIKKRDHVAEVEKNIEWLRKRLGMKLEKTFDDEIKSVMLDALQAEVSIRRDKMDDAARHALKTVGGLRKLKSKPAEEVEDFAKSLYIAQVLVHSVLMHLFVLCEKKAIPLDANGGKPTAFTFVWGQYKSFFDNPASPTELTTTLKSKQDFLSLVLAFEGCVVKDETDIDVVKIAHSGFDRQMGEFFYYRLLMVDMGDLAEKFITAAHEKAKIDVEGETSEQHERRMAILHSNVFTGSTHDAVLPPALFQPELLSTADPQLAQALQTFQAIAPPSEKETD